MTLTIVLNVVLAIGVSVMVVAPLVWAILTQTRDHPRPVLRERPAVRHAEPPPGGPSLRGSRPAYKAVAGRT